MAGSTSNNLFELSEKELATELTKAGLCQQWADVLEDNEVSGFIFANLTESDLHQMLPGKVGIVRKMLLLRTAMLEGTCFAFVGCPDAHSSTQFVSSSGSASSDTVPGTSFTVSSVSPLPAETDNCTGHATESSVVADTPTDRQRCVLPPLPRFSAHVQDSLMKANILPIFNKVIEECAYHLLQHGDIGTKTEYEEFGALMFEKYPCIGFEAASQKKPWSFFCQKLSQKLRNVRWARRKKLKVFPQRLKSVDLVNYSGADQATVGAAKEELNTELEKPKPNLEKAKEIFRFLAEHRREQIKQKDRSITSILEEFPPLRHSTFIREELAFLCGVEIDQMQERYMEMLRKLDIVFRTDDDDVGEEQRDDASAEIDLLLHLQLALDEKKIKRVAIRQAIDVVDACAMNCTSKKKDPPSLLVARHERGMPQAWLLADGIAIQCQASNNTLFFYLLDLIGSYYAWDLAYPKSYQILGFMQLHILEDQAPFFRTTKFMKFEKAYREIQ